MLNENGLIIENGKLNQSLGIYGVSGLLFWYKPDDKPDNTRLSSVTDKAGSGYSMIQSLTDRQPLHKLNQINGYPAILFDLNGSLPVNNQGSLFGSKTGVAAFYNNRVVEIFTVCKFTKPTTGVMQINHFRGINATFSQRILTTGRLSVVCVDSLSNTITTTLTNVLNDNQWYLFYMKLDFTGTFNRELYVEGVGNITATSNNTFNITNENLRLGSSTNTQDLYVAENIVCSNSVALSSSDKNIILTELKNKYNL